MFLVMKIRKNIQSMLKKQEKHIDLLLIGEEGKSHYVLTKDFDTFVYDHTLHHGIKNFMFLIVYMLLI